MRLLATTEGLDDAHWATAIGARFSECERNNLCRWRVIRSGGFCPKQGPGLGNVGLAGGTSQQAVVTNAVETVWQHVDQEATDEIAS